MPKNTSERSIDRPYTPLAGHSAVLVGSSTPGITDHGALTGLGDDDHPHYLTVPRADVLYVPVTRQAGAGAGLSGGGALGADITFTVNVSAPIAIAADAVSLTYGSGLTLSGSTLIADLGAALTFSGNHIALSYDSTLAVATNAVGVNLPHDFNWTGTHSWTTGETLQSYGTVITPGVNPGYGWKITNTTGYDAALTIPNIWVGNLHAQAFILDTARVDVGEEIWARSRAVLYADMVTPSVSGTATMIVEIPPGIDGLGEGGNAFHLFGDGHYVRLRIFDSTQGLSITDAWGTVVYVSGTAGGTGEPDRQTYTFTMLYGTVGATIKAGSLVLGYGTPGDSFVLITVVKQGAPYMDFLRWGISRATGLVDPVAVPWQSGTGADTWEWEHLTRVGNLTGVADTAFGGSLTGAGLYGSNTYLTGALQLAGTAPLAGPGAVGLYGYGDRFGFWDGEAWTTYLDDGGNFTFKAGADSEGSTKLTYVVDYTETLGDPPVTYHYGARLGAQRYSGSYVPAGWKYTWYADGDTGALIAGADGEVVLHNYGISLVGYTGTEVSPLYNTKSLAFFRTQAEALTNVSLAHARIWGGIDIDKDSVDADANPESILQLEIGVDGAGAGVIASSDRPHIALMYMPEMEQSGSDRTLRMAGWNRIEIKADADMPTSGAIFLNAVEVNVGATLKVSDLLPNPGGAKSIGMNASKYEDIYVKRIHADEVLAPQFTGRNTVGAKVSIGGTSLNHGANLISPWTEVRDESNFYSGGANNDRLTADADGWYYVTLTLISSTQPDPRLWVEVNNGIMLWETRAYGGHGVVGGPIYLSAGNYVRGFVETSGITTIVANMIIVRSGTQGGAPTSDTWTGLVGLTAQVDYEGDGSLHVTNAHPGGTITLTVDGNINATSFNGETFTGVYGAMAAAAESVDALYLLKTDAEDIYATITYVGNLFTPLDARVAVLEGSDPYSQYVTVATARTITATHTFAPTSPQPPFTLGVNASGQHVPGFNADYLDGHHWSEIVTTAGQVLTLLLTVDGAGSALDADLLDGQQGAAYALVTTTFTAGDGLTGGGTLGANRTFALTTPGTLTAGTGNSAAGNHTHAIDASIARSAVVFTAGAGLTGGGDLSTSRSFDVGQGDGLTVTANAVALTLPGTLGTTTGNVSAGNHTHAITTSSDPGTNAYILASAANGYLTLVGLTGTTKLTTPLIEAPATMTIKPTGSLTLDPTGDYVLPGGNIDVNLGDINRRWKTVYVAELMALTLVRATATVNMQGRMLFTSASSSLIADAAFGDPTIDVKDADGLEPFANGEHLLFETAPGGVQQYEIMTITSGATPITGGYRYSVTRNRDGTGANNWVAGDVCMSLGVTAGDGYIDLIAAKTTQSHYGPSIVTYARTGTAWDAIKPTTVQGNLRSYVDYAGDEYGFAAGNDLTLNTLTGFSGMTIDRTNGAQIYNGALHMFDGGEEIARLDAAAGLTLVYDRGGPSAITWKETMGGDTIAYIDSFSSLGYNYVRTYLDNTNFQYAHVELLLFTNEVDGNASSTWSTYSNNNWSFISQSSGDIQITTGVRSPYASTRLQIVSSVMTVGFPTVFESSVKLYSATHPELDLILVGFLPEYPFGEIAFFWQDDTKKEASIRAVKSGGSWGSKLIFSTSTDNILTLTDRGAVDDNGNFGFGTILPKSRAHVLTSGTSTWASAYNRGLLLTDAIGPRLVFEDTGESADDKIMLLKYESQALNISSMNDAGTAWDKENILVVSRDGYMTINGTNANQARLTIATPTSASFEPMIYFREGVADYGFKFLQDDAVSGDMRIDRIIGGASNPIMTFARATGYVAFASFTPVTPAYSLQVFGDSSSTKGIASTRIVDSTGGGLLFLQHARATGSQQVATNDELGKLIYAGYDGATGYVSSAAIVAYCDGAVSSGTVPGALSFATGTTATRTERLRISSGGLIKTSSLIYITGSVGETPTGAGIGMYYGTVGAVYAYDYNASAYKAVVLNDCWYVSGVNNNTLNAYFGNAAHDYDGWVNYRGYQDGHSYRRNFVVGDGQGGTIARFDANGKKFGIGTTPQYRLDVEGGALQAGTWYVNSQFVQDKTNYRGLFLGFDTSGQIGIIGSNTAASASKIAFWTYSGSAWGERVRISTAGLGIFTEASTPLEVYNPTDNSWSAVIRNNTGSNGYGLLIECVNSYGGTPLLYCNSASGWDAFHVTCAGNAYAGANMSAASFTDRTPGYEGDALKELGRVRNKNGKIDHNSLPPAAHKRIDNGNGTVDEGRDISMMVSILTRAVQQLTEQNKELVARVAELEAA